VILLFLWQTIEPLRSLKDDVKSNPGVRRQAEMLKAKVYNTLAQLPAASTGNRLAVLAQMTVSDICDTSYPAFDLSRVLHKADEVLGPEPLGPGPCSLYGGQEIPNWGNVSLINLWGHIPHLVLGNSSLGSLRCLNAAIGLFAHLFAAQSGQNQQRVLTHLAPVVRTARSGQRKAAVCGNVCGALLAMLKRLVGDKARLHKDVSLTPLLEVGFALAGDAETSFRRIAGEILGCTVALADGSATQEVVGRAIQAIGGQSESISKSGWGLTLGCINRYQGFGATQRTLPETVI